MPANAKPETESDRMRLDRLLEREREKELLAKIRQRRWDGIKAWSQWLTGLAALWIGLHAVASDAWNFIGSWLRGRG